MDIPHYDMVIVGAGLSGLSAATYLAKAGKSVLVLEKSPNCGGLLQSFSRNGYVFDAGARSIENSGIIKPMLAELDIEMELLESPVSLGIEQDSIPMQGEQSLIDYQHLLQRLYPQNKQDIQKISKVIRKVYKEMQVIYGFENPVFKNFRQDKQYLFKELLPWFGRFIIAVRRMEKLQTPIESYLEALTSNQSLVDIIAQHFFKKTPAFFALGYFFVYQDYFYPKGGTGQLSIKLQQKAQDLGATFKLNTEVVNVLAAKKQVLDDKGQAYSYETLLWCGDLKFLYRNLDTSMLEPKAVAAIGKQAEKVFSSRGGDSVFTLFLGVEQEPQAFAERTKAHLFYTPSKQGLGQTHLSQLKTLLDNGLNSTKAEILSWVQTYCALTTYEISIPSLRDPSLSPQGKTGLVISFLLEYDLVRLVSDQQWYEEFKKYVEEQMIKILNQTIFSGLLDTIELKFSASPLSLETRFNNSEGGITGWTFEQPSPAVSKLPKIPASVKTPIPSVMQCGQWAYSPAGIPTAILTGWYAYDELIRKK